MGGEVLELRTERVYKKGERAGEKKGRVKELVALVEEGLLTVAQAAARLGEPEEAFRARLVK